MEVAGLKKTSGIKAEKNATFCSFLPGDGPTRAQRSLGTQRQEAGQ